MLWTRRQLLIASGGAAWAARSWPRHCLAAPVSDYQNLVLAKNPVGYWRLGESQGTIAKDGSGRGHHGRCHGTQSWQQPGALHGDADTSLGLDGKGSYLEIPTHPDFSQPTSGRGLTVEAWLRPDALEFAGEAADPYVYWLGKGQPNTHEWALRFYSRASPDRPNRISAYLFNPEGGLGAGAYFQDELRAGEWIHVVACYEPGNAATNREAGVHIYKNGEHRLGPPAPGALYNSSQWQINPRAGVAPLRLGTYNLKSFLKGGLDEVAIYQRVLTAREIQEHYRIGQRR